MKCEDCLDTGLIEVESVRFGRTHYRNGRLETETYGLGDWHKAQCHCVGEEEE